MNIRAEVKKLLELQSYRQRNSGLGLMRTRGGMLCVHTGENGTRISKPGIDRLGNPTKETYVRVQILPAAPQRVEWVNEKNLRG